MTFGMGDEDAAAAAAAMDPSLLFRQEIQETRPGSSSSIHAVKVAPASVTCGTETYFSLYEHLHTSFPILLIVPSSFSLPVIH